MVETSGFAARRRIGTLLAALVLVAGAHALGENTVATILSSKVICKQSGRYIGWPTIAKRGNGELVAVFSGDRDAHVCPWGKTQMVRSTDGGHTWSEPVTINNTPLDDRDAGVIETKSGTLLVSWFTSLAFDNPKQVDWQRLPEDVLTSWKRHSAKLGPEIREEWLGHWVRRSTDSGQTWGRPIRTNGSAPHGPIELSDGRLLFVGKGSHEGQRALTVEESCDDGLTWRLVSTVPLPDDESMDHYHEPHAAETDNGRLVALFRYQPRDSAQCLLRQSESADAGATWSVTHPTPIWGYPPHLVRLANGWLLVAYGRRKPPFSERACISKDGGNTWDVEHEITVADASSGDLGYPASVQLDDGSIFSVYYQIDQPGEKTCLMGTHWRLNTLAP